MTTTNVAGGTPVADFPITWNDPAQSELTWFQDVMHNPLPVTPLSATLFQPAFAEGASRAIGRLSMPITGLSVTVQNGYVYLGRPPAPGTPAEIEARFPEMQRIAVELGSTVLRDWRETFEPQVLARCERVLAFDYDGASLAEIASFVAEIRRDMVDVWDIHMRINIPAMNIVFGFEEFLSEVLGPEAARQSRALLQGFDNKSLETGRALWSLSRWVRNAPGLTTAILNARVRDGVLEIPEHAKSEEFEGRWHGFLDTYGWRSDRFMELGHPSWREDPSTPLTQLKGYLALEDAQDPFAAQARLAVERDQLATEMEARLPEPARPQFRAMLPMAQQFLPISEDHNFTIDQKFTVVVRTALLHLGARMAAEGMLADRDSVFYTTYDEVCEIAAGRAVADLDARTRQRRREHARQATLQAPPLIGAPPPPDVPLDPLAAKFFGIGIVPSEDRAVVTGHPCSNGVVTGVAKVVLTLDEAGKVNAGDILVCRMTMPAWTPLFGIVGAVVADAGGPLSHCAIVAREYMIPCVAGTVNGTQVLKDGMRVRVDGNTGVVTVLAEGRSVG